VYIAPKFWATIKLPAPKGAGTRRVTDLRGSVDDGWLTSRSHLAIPQQCSVRRNFVDRAGESPPDQCAAVRSSGYGGGVHGAAVRSQSHLDGAVDGRRGS